ncbi:hypothetical protein WJX72_000328 [[Myrmecia] bisecta]|uniref:Type I phosphodiesterase/nucleotide pyrophosphatase n=1 Tax=[Myrmecia] bisecta TaxID=41462 RepID=A0AAW1Q379_9CHLO
MSSAQAGLAITLLCLSVAHGVVDHVLVISVDGLRSVDLANYVKQYPNSALASLEKSGVTYTKADTSAPSDSFPGTLALFTGGSPKTTGVYYDDSYDRSVFPPMSNCTGTPGSEVVFDENVDRNQTTATSPADIAPELLPQQLVNGSCVPFYPHDFPLVNNVFGAIHAGKPGARTAWIDKHPAYDLLNGKSGKDIDDLYTPEIAVYNETFVGQYIANDNQKVAALLNQITGKTASGNASAPVPTILGMNFQSVSDAQKYNLSAYTNHSTGQFAPDFLTAFNTMDSSLTTVLAALKTAGLANNTAVVLTSKHGQSPLDTSLVERISPIALMAAFPEFAVAKLSGDDIALLWLNSTVTNDAATLQTIANNLMANKTRLGVKDVLVGAPLNEQCGSIASRVPDMVVTVDTGVIYVKEVVPGKLPKQAEHGGIAQDDRHVGMIVNLANYVQQFPGSALAGLQKSGVTYTQANASAPSDSFPGTLALFTGGSPKSTGVYYDDSYDRTLFPPKSSCAGRPGTAVDFDESVDANQATATSPADIAPKLLPLQLVNGACVPFYPHDLPLVNNVFGVVHAAKPGARTAWIDKHPSYDLLNGKSGRDVDDLFTPEIANRNKSLVAEYIAADDQKVAALLNQINGKTASGMAAEVPAIYGMSFQAVDDAQQSNLSAYTDLNTGQFAPDFLTAITAVDNSLKTILAALQTTGLANNTAITITSNLMANQTGLGILDILVGQPLAQQVPIVTAQA